MKIKKVNVIDIQCQKIDESILDIYCLYYLPKGSEYLLSSKEFGKYINYSLYYHANRTIGGRIKFKSNSSYIIVV